MTSPNVDVHVGFVGLETVRCSPSRAKDAGATLVLDRVAFHDLPDDTLQQIADAIELYLIRKNQRQRKEKAKPAIAAPAETPEVQK